MNISKVNLKYIFLTYLNIFYMVIIRLARSGAKKNPYYFITVADERRPRDGAFIERLGFFNLWLEAKKKG